MRDVLTIQRPTTAQNEFGGNVASSYTTIATIRCSATQFSGDASYRDYNQDETEQDWQLLVRKKSLPALDGSERFSLETPAISLKLNSLVEQDIRTYRLRLSAIS